MEKIGRYRKVWRIKDIIPLGKYIDVFADFKRTMVYLFMD